MNPPVIANDYRQEGIRFIYNKKVPALCEENHQQEPLSRIAEKGYIAIKNIGY